VTSLYIDAIAPTNFIVTNPAALKKAFATKGTSVMRGFANLVDDLASGRLLPRQVDARPFTSARTSPTRPAPWCSATSCSSSSSTSRRPSKSIGARSSSCPPQINKYYAFDLAPGKSIVQWALASGVRTFAVSWRNPTAKNAQWGFDAYVAALDEAVDAIREITGSKDVNAWGACSGGITLTAFLGWLAARGQRKVHSATLAVCVLDTSAVQNTTAGLCVTPVTIEAAKAASRKRGVVEGTDLARMFAWMRPNDLVWNYVINNYLLGNEPPAHDILFWNNDATRLPAQLHADFLDLIENNTFAHPRTLTVRGRKIDIGKIGIDTFVVAGLADHITPWEGVYRTARLYGGARATFALSNGGHIQSLINPARQRALVVHRRSARAATRKRGSRTGRKSREAGGRCGANGFANAPARCGPRRRNWAADVIDRWRRRRAPTSSSTDRR
jgi:polyhydroxyalkanoate synthase